MKTDEIRKLLKKGVLSVKEIAVKLNTKEGYVQTLKRDLLYAEAHKTGFRSYQRKWRKKHKKIRNKDRGNNYEKGSVYNINSGKIYSQAEKRLIMEFAGTDRELAKTLGRTVLAIQDKRFKMRSEMTNFSKNNLKKRQAEQSNRDA